MDDDKELERQNQDDKRSVEAMKRLGENATAAKKRRDGESPEPVNYEEG